MAPYLVKFVHRWHAMRVPELEAMAELLGIELHIEPHMRELLAIDHRAVIDDDAARLEAEMLECSALVLELRSDADAVRLASRLVLVDSISALWGQGATWADAMAAALAVKATRIDPFLTADSTFRVRFDAFGATYQTPEQIALMKEHLPGLDLQGRVRLKGADHTIVMFADHCIHQISEVVQTGLRAVFIGRRVATSPGLSHADKYRLPERRFLGPTSMDHQLSMIIANQAHARPGTLVLDPFCGTASILIGCAAFGARVLGCDLDARFLVGKGEGRTIGANFAQYALVPPVGLQRADFSADGDCWRALPFLDAVVCDPPYGVRASSKKLAEGAGNSLRAAQLRETDNAPFLPQRERLDIEPLLERLLEFAASRLVLGGRLVFLLPVTSDMSGTAAPEHPALRLCAESVQPISRRWCRRLVTMEKVRPCTPEMAVSFARREASLFDTAKLGKDVVTSERKLRAKQARDATAAAKAQRPPATSVPKRSAPDAATIALAVAAVVLLVGVALRRATAMR
jgi:tRNA (guanine10-N2)-methyltransferase